MFQGLAVHGDNISPSLELDRGTKRIQKLFAITVYDTKTRRRAAVVDVDVLEHPRIDHVGCRTLGVAAKLCLKSPSRAAPISVPSGYDDPCRLTKATNRITTACGLDNADKLPIRPGPQCLEPRWLTSTSRFIRSERQV